MADLKQSNSLKALPTQEGLDILNSTLKGRVGEYILIGASGYKNAELSNLLDDPTSATYESVRPFIFYRGSCESILYDENGVLTFEIALPMEEDLQFYTYAVGLLSKGNILVCLTQTPKIVLIRGVGGKFIVKVAVKGEAGEIVFKNGEGVSREELIVFQNMTLRSILEIGTAQIEIATKLAEKGVL